MAASTVNNGLPEGFVLDKPQDNSGLPSGFVLDKPEEAPQSYGANGVARGIARNLLENVVKGVGSTLNTPYFSDSAREFGNYLTGQGNAWEKQMEVGDDQYGKSHSAAFDWKKPSTWGEAPYAIAETLPSVAVSAAMPELRGAGFLASEAAQHYGQNLSSRMANQPEGAEPTGADQIAAGASTLGQAALARFGLNKLHTTTGLGAGISGGVGKFAGDMAKATVANAGTGAAGNMIDQVGRKFGTNSSDPVLDKDEIMNAGVLGGLQGAALRGVQLPGDVRNAIRMAPLGGTNAQASADLAARLTQAATDSKGADTRSASGAAQAHNIVRGLLSEDTSRAISDPNGAGAILDSNPGLKSGVSETLAKLKAGQVLPEKQLSGLQDSLGDEGAPLSHLLRVQNAQNIVKSFGNFTEDSHQGGILGGSIGKFTDIPGLFHSKGGAHNVPVNLIATLALGHEALGAVGGNALAALAAGATLARPAFKGIDVMLGNHNPTQQFMDRFGGRKFSVPVAPSPEDKDQNMKLPDAVRAQIMAKQFQDQQATAKAEADSKAMFASRASALADDKAFNAARDQNVPSPTVKQLKTLAGLQASDAIKAAKAKAKTTSKGSVTRDIGGSMEPYSGPTVGLNAPEASHGGPPSYLPPAFLALKAKAAMENRPIGAAPGMVSNMPEAAPSGPPSYLPPNLPLVRAQKVMERAKIGSETGQVPKDNMPGPGSSGPPIHEARGYMALEKLQKSSKGEPEPKTKETEKPAQEAPKAQETVKNGEPTIVVEGRNGRKIERPLKGIADQDKYVSKVERSMEVREKLGDDLKETFSRTKHHEIDTLINQINTGSKSTLQAQQHFETFVYEHLPEKAWESAWDIWNAHADKIRRTFHE